MFRRRLTLALALLATVAAFQGAAALWSIGVAEHQVLSGRVAADIRHGFAELVADKQRLRAWVAERQPGEPGDTTQRDQLIAGMRATLDQLRNLAVQMSTLEDGPAAQARQAQRADALAVLGRNLEELATVLAADVKAGVALPFDQGEGRDLRLLLAESIEREAQATRDKRAAADDALASMRRLSAGAALTLVLAALLLAWHFARALRRPLDALSQGAQALQRGDLGHRIGLAGGDEFATLARNVDTMAAELQQHRAREARERQALEEQVQARTIELQRALLTLKASEARRRQLFADISHELRTPATAIRGEAQITLRGADKEAADYKAALQRIADASRQLGLVIEDLLTMARSDIDALSLRRAPLLLDTVLDEVLSHGQALGRERQVEVDGEPWPAGLCVLGDAARLRQLLLALLDNAVRYSHPQGQVRLSARQADARVEVRIEDHGIGIEAEDLPHVFERNRRGARARRHRADGTGLGLAIARTLARGHEGDIELQSTQGVGTMALLWLPLHNAANAAPPAALPAPGEAA